MLYENDKSLEADGDIKGDIVFGKDDKNKDTKKVSNEYIYSNITC